MEAISKVCCSAPRADGNSQATAKIAAKARTKFFANRTVLMLRLTASTAGLQKSAPKAAKVKVARRPGIAPQPGFKEAPVFACRSIPALDLR